MQRPSASGLPGLSSPDEHCLHCWPKYQRPEARVPTAYKELPPASFKAADGWKVAQPNDEAPRGKWWEVFQSPELNALEEQVDISNQTLAVAEAQLRGARAAIGVARPPSSRRSRHCPLSARISPRTVRGNRPLV